MCGGWLKIHRKIIDSSIFNSHDPYLIQLWMYILVKVNHEPRKVLINSGELSLEAGQGIFGLNQIVKDLSGVIKESLPEFKKLKTLYYRRLKMLEKIENVKLNPTNKFTVVTVVNWCKYQDIETQVKLKRNSSETQVKTPKELKNYKNVKNIDIATAVLPFLEKYSKEMIQDFVQYWTEKDINGTERWKKQEAFEVGRRLATWKKNEKPKFNNIPAGNWK